MNQYKQYSYVRAKNGNGYLEITYETDFAETNGLTCFVDGLQYKFARTELFRKDVKFQRLK